MKVRRIGRKPFVIGSKMTKFVLVFVFVVLFFCSSPRRLLLATTTTESTKKIAIETESTFTNILPLLNEVRLIASSISPPSVVTKRKKQQPSEALVFIVTQVDQTEEVYSNIFLAKTIGKWDKDIIIIMLKEITADQQEAFKCLGVKYITIGGGGGGALDRDLFRGRKWVNPETSKMVLFLLPELRMYSFLRYASTVATVQKINEDEFGNNAILFETTEKSISKQVFMERMLQSTILSQVDGFSIHMNRIEDLDTKTVFDELNRLMETTKKMYDFNQLVMIIFWGRWVTKHTNMVIKYDLEEQKLRTISSIILASRTLHCPVIASSVSVEIKHSPEMDFERILRTISSFGSEYIQAAGYLTTVATTNKKKRVLLVWGSKDFVVGSYPVLFQLRTIGNWHEDIVLMTDEVSENNMKILNKLNVGVYYYSKKEFKSKFPWISNNHWYYKLVPYVTQEFREYEIIQYLDLDVIVTGPIKKYDPSDFEDGVTLIMEDNGGDDTSILEREWIRRKLMDVPSFVKRFPGSDEPLNGPNKSPSGGACFTAALSSRLEPVDTLWEMLRNIARDYDYALNWGDQPLLMLTLWGRWRMIPGGGEWRRRYEQVFDEHPEHALIHEPVKYVHTGGHQRPPLENAPLHTLELFTKLLGAEVLNLPEMTYT